MLIQEYYRTRNDGVRLIRSYSNQHLYIRSVDGTDYEEAIDPEDAHRTYVEINIPIPDFEEPEISTEEVINIILGGAEE